MIKIKLRQLLWDKEITATAVHKATGISQSILSDIVRGLSVGHTCPTINFVLISIYELS